MNLVFNKEGEYTSPTCRVYSVNLEGVMITTSTGEEIDPSPETDPYEM